MNSTNAIIERFVSFSDYLGSSEFTENPTANIFSPLRKVSSEPARNNYLPLSLELKFEIAKYLGLKDFISFSSINIDNYCSLRSDDLLVRRVIDNELPAIKLKRLEDLQHKASKYPFDVSVERGLEEHYKAKVCTLASSPGPSRLIFSRNPLCDNFRTVYFVKLFQRLCMLANDNSTDVFCRAHICSLSIDINNRMSLKDSDSKNATLLALLFIDIASQINQLTSFADKENKLHILANMIENNKLQIDKLGDVFLYKTVLKNKTDFDWEKFINHLI